HVADQSEQHVHGSVGDALLQRLGQLVLELGSGGALDQFFGGVLGADVLAGRLHGGLDDVGAHQVPPADVGDDFRRIRRRDAPHQREVGFDQVSIAAVEADGGAGVVFDLAGTAAVT